VSHPNSTFIELLYHDNIRLFAQLAALVIDNNMCDELVARRNQGAQVLLDLLQMVRTYFLAHHTTIIDYEL
jgi:hypothetical protein